jgi:hypothetical protein
MQRTRGAPALHLFAATMGIDDEINTSSELYGSARCTGTPVVIN